LKSFFDAIHYFKDVSPSQLKFPKLHNLVHLRFFLRQYVHFENFDTEEFEQFHTAMVARPYQKSNKQKDKYLQQMATIVTCEENQEFLEKEIESTLNLEIRTQELESEIGFHNKLLGKGKSMLIIDLPKEAQRFFKNIESVFMYQG